MTEHGMTEANETAAGFWATDLHTFVLIPVVHSKPISVSNSHSHNMTVCNLSVAMNEHTTCSLIAIDAS